MTADPQSPGSHQGDRLPEKRFAPRSLFRRLKLSGLQGKLILPYMLLTLILAIAGTFVITRLVTSSVRERFVNQLFESARKAADGMVRVERQQLEHLRPMVFTAGVSQAIRSADTRTLSDLLLPLAFNHRDEFIVVLDSRGRSLLELTWNPFSLEYESASGSDFGAQPLVAKVLAGETDQYGDKYLQILDTRTGPVLFTSAPVLSEAGRPLGAILVGTHLQALLSTLQRDALADVILLDENGALLLTTLPQPEGGYALLEAAARPFMQDASAPAQELQLYDRGYEIQFAPWLGRERRLGWLGVALPDSFVTAAETTSRNTFAAVFTLSTAGIILVGYLLSRAISEPVLALRSMTQEVAAGDLNQRIDLSRQDEIGELAAAFNRMTQKLRKRTGQANYLYAQSIRRNRELAEINTRLQSTQQQLIQSEKLASIGHLTAGIIHDVKNPLGVIKGMGQLLQMEPELKDREEVAYIIENADRANTIVNDLLTFARQSEIALQTVDLRETVDASARLTAYLTRKAGARVRIDLPEQPVIASCDPRQIEQVLINLIHNAVQAMNGNGLLELKLESRDHKAHLTVRDNGCGIPPENLHHIFDPFFTTKPEGEGTGLGLSVSYGIIRSHRGHIEVQSRPGEGAEFTVLLPLENTGMEVSA